MKNSHKHFLARLLVGAFIILGMGFWMSKFVVDASTWTIGGISWDNTNFLNQDFWSNSPNSGDVVKALFGSGDEHTAYTMGRSGYNSGTCPISGMTVQYLTPGLSSLPMTLSSNTIYVLEEGDYITTGGITIDGDCIAVVGSGDVYLYSTGMLYDPTDGYKGSMFYSSGKNQVLIDNVSINGAYDGQGVAHSGIYQNDKGVSLIYVTNSTLNDVKAYNNDKGIYLFGTHNVFINKAKTFNNDAGILFYGAINSSINNSIIFGNESGIGILYGNSNTVNNCSIFNNHTESHYGGGISIGTTDNFILHQTDIHNNDVGIFMDTSTGSFYGTINMFGNSTYFTGVSGGEILFVGTGISSLGRTTGSIYTGGTFDRGYLINPEDGDGDQLSNRGTSLYTTGVDTSWNGIPSLSYSFGRNILTQIQPVAYNGTDLVTGGSYDSTYFIGSSITPTTGSIAIDGTQTNVSGINITITTVGNQAYRLFGDIVSERSGVLTTSLTTGLILSGSDGTKYVFVQIRSGGNRTTHYADSILLDTVSPTFTGITLSSLPVVTGGYYNTGITIDYYDTDLSGALLDGVAYVSGTLITGAGIHTFFVDDALGNFAGMTFTIDTTLPLLTGTLASGSVIVSGGQYDTTGITLSFSDTNLSGAILSGINNSYLSGNFSNGATITGNGTYVLTVYDLAGNTTSITFTIDLMQSINNNLIASFFGSGNVGTTHTQHWTGYNSGSCLASGMNVSYISAGTSTLPLTLSDNTLYVLTGTDYIVTGAIQLDTCTALVSQSGSRLFSTAQIATLLTITGDNFVIVDNITVNGESNGSGSNHLRNPNGIKIQNANNITIHDSKFYRNGTEPEIACGIHMVNANYTHIIGTDVYEDADYGISLDNSHYNTIEDSSFYNNGLAGIILSGSSYNIFNNVKSYNNYYNIYDGNNNNGLEIKLASRYNSFNNMAIFNNGNYGIKISNSSTNTFNNVSSFSNRSYGIYSSISNSLSLNNVHIYNNYYGISGANTTGSYYGEIKLFSNITDNTVPSWLSTGLEISSLGRATGYITTGTNSRNYFINPKNGSGTYLLNWTTSLPALRSASAWSGEILPINYSFGGSLPTQIQPIIYSGGTRATGGTYDASYFVGSSITPISGSLTVTTGIYTNSTSITVDITSATTPNYRIFGDVTSEKSGAYITTITTGFTLSGTDGTKQVIIQFWNDTTDRATHYADDVILDTTMPAFTGTIASGTIITSGGYYNTGVTMMFTDTNLSGATLNGVSYTSGTLITGDGTYVFIVSDLANNSTGITFTIDTIAPVITGISPASGSVITGSNIIIFTWTGIELNQLSGYQLFVVHSGTVFATGAYTGATSYSLTIPNGTGYGRDVVVYDRAGNLGYSATIPFSVNVPFSGTVSLSGTAIQLSGSAKYVSSTFPVYMFSNATCTYTITGDTITTGYSGTLTGGAPLTINAIASGADGLKTLYVALYSGAQVLTTTLTGYLDTTAPSAPTLSTPTSGTITSGAITLAWLSAIDSGVGLSGYRWNVSTTGTFATTTLSGFATGTTATLDTGALGVTGTFYWRVISQDKLGRTGTSTYRDFYYSGQISTPTSFTFDRISNARLNRTYLSSTEDIEGMSSGTYSLATVSKGILYINDDEIGATGLVKNGDTINIELISSDEYDDTVTSTLTIGSFSTTFRVTTKEEATSDDEDEDIEDIEDIETDLSSTEKLQIVAVFLALRDVYSDSTLRTTFFNALLDSLQNRIDALDDTDDNDQKKIDALQYLYDVIENYLGGDVDTDDTVIGNNNRYVAPNGKVYQITYNSSTKLYTSPDFVIKKTFTAIATLKSYIDINNGGRGPYQGGTFSPTVGSNHTVDTSWQAAPYTAPNGKVYRLFKTTDGRYSSYYFQTAKYFVSVDALKNHIYQWNR